MKTHPLQAADIAADAASVELALDLAIAAIKQAKTKYRGNAVLGMEEWLADNGTMNDVVVKLIEIRERATERYRSALDAAAQARTKARTGE